MEHITSAFVKKYTRNNRRHEAYAKTVDIYNHLRFHVDGFEYRPESNQMGFMPAKSFENPYFKILIGDYRPGESDKVMTYRKKIYTSISAQPCFKVINSLKKIVKAEDFSIDWEKSESPASVAANETLHEYTTKNYPKRFKSVEGWFYQFGLRQLLTDPNAVVYTLPLNVERESTEYSKPFTFIAHSDQVLDYKTDELCIVLSTEQSTYGSGDKKYTDGKILYIFQAGSIHKATQINSDGDFQIEPILIEEGMPMQAFRAGFGEAVDMLGNETVFSSYISPMLPNLDKMAREGSDLDAAVVRNLHPREWEISTTECSNCNGTGNVVSMGSNIACGKCKGIGALKSPFTSLIIKNGELGQNAVPTPPAGVVQRDNATIELQDKRVDNHGVNALATLNMEFLADNPLNQSGVAKEIDRDELNNFIFTVAQNLVEVQLTQVFKQIAQQRYWTVTAGNEETIREMLPHITVPTKFDLLSENTSIDRLKKMSDAGVDPAIVAQQQQDVVNKMYYQDEETKEKLSLIFKLNPFTGKSSEEVGDELLQGLITKRDAVLSMNVELFVKQACQEDPDFLKNEYENQKQTIMKMLDEKLVELGDVSSSGDVIELRDGNGLSEGAGTDTPIDVEAEAKAKLKGTVGGVNGIVNIAESVASGSMSEDAGKAVLMEIYGFSNELAGRMLKKGSQQLKKELEE